MPALRRAPAALLLAAAALAAPAVASAAAPPAPRVVLPGAASAASVRADPATWIVGARPGAASARLAARHGARAVAPELGAYVVARGRAHALAADLERAGRLVFAEPNRLAETAQAPPPPDPLDAAAGWRDAVVDPTLAPPAVSPQSPLLALVDSPAELGHPEFALGSGVTTLGGLPVTESHGTATAAVAGAPANGRGIRGIWPGMRALNVPLSPQRITCADSARQITRAVRAGAGVINMSYGSADLCTSEYVALQYATGRRIVLVAAAGNEFAAGNPLEYPASLPHVLTVAAVGSDLRSAAFSNESLAMDLSAPGVGILTAVRPGEYGDVDGDGYAALDGTSFAAPMVAAAAAWVRATRPDLSGDQVAQVVRRSARDLQAPGRDQATGFGLLDVRAALALAPPPRDPLEPNDDMIWVDGRAFKNRDPVIWRGGRARVVTALLDRFEDPADVYRVRLPARSRAVARLRPHGGNADLAAYTGRARSLRDARRRTSRARRSGQRTDRVTLVNGSRRARTVYVAATVARGGDLDVTYTLTVGRR